MKKLLSLLSVLTISGTSVPTTIAASPYQKEKKLNSEINLETNNLKKINRVKRQQNQKTSRSILTLNEKLIIDSNNSREYINSSRRILHNLEVQRVLIPVINVGEENQDSIIYTLNIENYGYLRIPVEIIGIDVENQQSYRRNLELVLRTDNLYLQGFIINNNYYHFNFNEINQGRNYVGIPQNQLTREQRRLLSMWNRQPRSVRDGSVPLLERVEGIESHRLSRIGPDYRDLLPQSNNDINWNNIFSSFLYLTNDIDINENNVRTLEEQGLPIEGLATSLGRVIFSASEAVRFRNIYNIINTDIINNNRNVNLSFRDDQIYQILVSWGVESRQYRSLLFNEQNIYQGFEYWYGIDRFIHNIIGHSEFSFINDLTPIDIITEYLRNFNTIVLLGVALPLTFGRITSNCNKNVRIFGTTKFENPFWEEQFCDFKPQIKKIDGEIKVTETLNKDIKSKNLKSGDIFVGTTTGLYLILENGTALKVENINTEVKSIKEFGNGNFYVSTNDKKVYFLNTKNLKDDHISGEILWNVDSSNLEKELILYYYPQNKEKAVEFYLRYGNKDTAGHIQSLYLNTINPIDNYEKIEFLGNVKTYSSWGNDPYPSNKTVQSYVENKNLKNLIVNKKIITDEEAKNNSDKVLQDLCDKSGTAGMCLKQSFGLTWYWENSNDNYYFQVIGNQYGETWSSFSGGGISMFIGNSVRLYND